LKSKPEYNDIYIQLYNIYMKHGESKLLMDCTVDDLPVNIFSNIHDNFCMTSENIIKINKLINKFTCNSIHEDVTGLVLHCKYLSHIPDLSNHIDSLSMDGNSLIGNIIVKYTSFSGTNNGITSVTITEQVEHLVLDVNKITVINILNNNNLKYLGLKYNMMTFLDLSTTNIKVVDISNNELEHIILPNTVQSAILNNNPLEKLEFPESTTGNHKLKILNVTNTSLSCIPNNIYVQQLYASCTKITKIPLNAYNVTVSCNDIDMIASHYMGRHIKARNCRIYKLIMTGEWNIDIIHSDIHLVDKIQYLPQLITSNQIILLNSAAYCIQRNWHKYLKNNGKDMDLCISI
jgi:hypothetical protein